MVDAALELLRDHPARREPHASRCRHLLVDEFQDTNASQYRLVKDLSSASGNIFVVGDEDQSIYRFRGADIGNILSFEGDFPGTRLIRLERNYRSTGKILAAAGAVVARNTERLGKNLYTENDEGEPVHVFQAGTDRDEASWLINQVRHLRDRDATPLEDQAILYRANFQSRSFEEALTRARIPYTIYGSVRFYERREVKDLLFYLRVLHNPDDSAALTRIINVPTRGIGRSTLETLEGIHRERGGSLHACVGLALAEKLLSPRQHGALSRFLELMDDLRDGMKGQPIRSLLEDVMNRTGYLDYLVKIEPISFEDRVKNLEALAVAGDEAEAEEGDLQAFLDRTALTTTLESEQGEGGVRLMTLHCAKGLEFPVVYIVGMEERLFPHARSVDTPSGLEEERRLFYVGITRAMSRLLLSHASMRSLYGNMQLTEPSRFLAEIPVELLEQKSQEIASLDSLFGGASRQAGRRAAARARQDDGYTSSPRRRSLAHPGPVISRGSGPRGEVTVEYDADALPPEESGDLFRVGMEVIHGKYGHGTILRREGSGPRLKLTVSFVGHGRKKFMARYAGLKIAP